MDKGLHCCLYFYESSFTETHKSGINIKLNTFEMTFSGGKLYFKRMISITRFLEVAINLVGINKKNKLFGIIELTSKVTMDSL